LPIDLSNRRQPEDKVGSGRPIYSDYNATTPHDPEVIAAMLPYLEGQPARRMGKGTVRLSTGRMTTQADIERVVQVLAESVVRMRRSSTGAQGTKP
jgi:cysteine sulfinate desulfinase/cysteine desulfurase-like protein